ncbi:MAG: GHMP kinase, partial [bacterium]|nr:GHMP kinase [bacterium]
MVNKKIINAVAPTRICDVGGWTDTHFARHGNVFNIAIYPYVEVQVVQQEHSGSDERVVISVENFGESYAVDPDNITYDKHPLIMAAIDVMELPEDTTLNINIFSYAPPGASTGTSAAVSVALIGALSALSHSQSTPYETAMLAHSLETEKLGLQCGVQDQLASAYGGINFISIHDFPNANVSSIQVPNSVWWELEQRLVLVFIGNPHSSSETHEMVIRDMGRYAHRDPRIQELRELAERAKDAVYEGNFTELGNIFDDNTKVQRALHKDLVCDAFEDIITVANDFDVLGCKVNGAGGDGGSIAVLTDG